MEVVKFLLFSLCVLANCGLLCSASSKNTQEDVNGLYSALKISRYRYGGYVVCESGSDCKENNEGCFSNGGKGLCQSCDNQKEYDKYGAKYDVSGCGLKTWMIVAIVIGILLLAAVVSLVVCFIVPSCPLAKRRKNRNRQYGQYPQADEQGQLQDQSGQYQGQPGQYQGQPGQYQSQPGQYQGQPGQYQGQPGQYQSQPGQYQGQPGQYQGQPGQYQGQPGQYQGQPGQYQGQPGQYQGQPGQYQGQPGQFQGQLGQYQGQPGQFQGQTVPPSGYAYGQAPRGQYAPPNMAMPSNNSGKKVSGSGSGSSSGSYSGSSASGESVKVAPGPGTKNPAKTKTKAVTHKTKK